MLSLTTYISSAGHTTESLDGGKAEVALKVTVADAHVDGVSDGLGMTGVSNSLQRHEDNIVMLGSLPAATDQVASEDGHDVLHLAGVAAVGVGAAEVVDERGDSEGGLAAEGVGPEEWDDLPEHGSAGVLNEGQRVEPHGFFCSRNFTAEDQLLDEAGRGNGTDGWYGIVKVFPVSTR